MCKEPLDYLHSYGKPFWTRVIGDFYPINSLRSVKDSEREFETLKKASRKKRLTLPQRDRKSFKKK